MINLPYLLLRFIRHVMPEKLVRFLLLNNWIIHPGMETDAPGEAAERYRQFLAEKGVSIEGKRILIFGYGGRFGVGCALLRMGAAQIVLCEKDVRPDDGFNHGLLEKYGDLLMREGGKVVPLPERIKVVEGDIRRLDLPQVDLVLSSYVYEHLGDVEGITRALAGLTAPGGVNIHFIDLRDHYFEYPFEMLRYSERTWRNWLNPSSNHNRYRLPQYRKAFESCFEQVDIKILTRDHEAFLKAKPRIRPEFLSGDPAVDDVTFMAVLASGVKTGVGDAPFAG
jgi:hypothetical protein